MVYQEKLDGFRFVVFDRDFILECALFLFAENARLVMFTGQFLTLDFYAFINAEVEFDKWLIQMKNYNQMTSALPWWRGDLYLYGRINYGETIASGIFDPLIWDVKTWQNNASVCSRVAISRRRETLSYTHHAEVAYLDPEDQEKYLQIAEDLGLTTRQLKELLEKDGKKKKNPPPPLENRIYSMAEKVDDLRDEAQGDVRDLLTTAAESLWDAFEIMRDS